MENKATFSAILEDMVQLDNTEGEAVAALMENPRVNWIKFVLTDDKPNGNKQRIPQEEFPNIINSGIYMPIKKAVGKTEKGHKDSLPLGVITHLKQVEDKIKGIAALWSKERPKDVEQIKSEVKSGKTVNLSWELSYDAEASEKKDGIETLKNVVLTGATIVGVPAYMGRTSVEAFASDKDKERKEAMAEEDEEKALEKLAKLQAKFEELQEKFDKEKETSLAKDKDLANLTNFKAEIEKINTEREKLSNIKQKFTTAKIVKEEKYFEENKEKLLSLDDNTLEFLLQDLKVFTPTEPDPKAPPADPKVPPITPKPTTEFTPMSIGQALRVTETSTGEINIGDYKMQINEFDDVMGVIPTEDIVEGRFVLLTEHSFSHNFGSQEDLVGVKLPDTTDEAARCKFIITWAVTNVSTPIYMPQPTLDQGARRGGWSESANTPIENSTIYLTYPGYTECQTIPSGTPSLVYTEGTFTLPYGCYVADANIIKPGSAIAIADTNSDGASDAGKPKYSSTKSAYVIGYTERYDSTTKALTIKVV